MSEQQPQRLQKLLGNAGVASRRIIEEMITDKRITVNGEIATLGMRATSDDEICLDGHKIALQTDIKTYLLHKPLGVISTAKDEHDRNTVVDLIDSDLRLYPIGRLDADTTGLILVSNDGELTNVLTHPKYGVKKKYVARLKGSISDDALYTLRHGVELEDGITAPASLKVIAKKPDESLIEITIHQGKNRQIRRMVQAVGFPIISLQRIQIGHLCDPTLSPGQYRELSASEILSLHRDATIS